MAEFIKTDLGDIPKYVYQEFKLLVELSENNNGSEIELKPLLPDKLHFNTLQDLLVYKNDSSWSHINKPFEFLVKNYKIYMILKYKYLPRILVIIIDHLWFDKIIYDITLLNNYPEVKSALLTQTTPIALKQIVDKYPNLTK